MIYLRSMLFGVAAAIAAAALWILAVFALPILVPILLSRVTGAAGIAAASVDSGSILAAAALGFAAGFSWTFARSRARNRAA